MPLAKVHLLEGQYNSARITQLSMAIQEALIEVSAFRPTTSSRSIMSCHAIAIATRRHLLGRNTRTT